MTFIFIMTAVIYILAIAWTWHNLGEAGKTKKVIFIIIGTLILYLITMLLFNFSQNGISYEQEEMKNEVRNIVVLLFTGINGVLILPNIARLYEKVQAGEMEKEKLTKRIIIYIVIWVICMWIEVNYMRSIQEGILQVFNANQQ